MPKLTIVHSTYRKNKYVNESVWFNLLALKKADIDFQYIVFNDHGDEDVYDDVKEFEPEIEYIYSEKNYGMTVCNGSWVGALPYIKGEYVHATGQDDVMTTLFYKRVLGYLESNKDVYVTYSNAFTTLENLKNKAWTINPQADQTHLIEPDRAFRLWFGIEHKKLTRANNGVLAAGAIYRSILHELIGLPDIGFGGALDFEYWARVLFNGYRISYIPEPLWLYRQSEFSAGKVEFRNDAGGNIHAVIGKLSFSEDDLQENIQAFGDHIKRLKPSSAKGVYIKKLCISATMSPSVQVMVA